MQTYLQKRQPAQKKMACFYPTAIMPKLFGEWTLYCEWGRIGQGRSSSDRLVRGREPSRCCSGYTGGLQAPARVLGGASLSNWRSLDSFIGWVRGLILAPTKRPLRDECAKNATPFVVCDAIFTWTGLPVSRFSSGWTKWNRTHAGPPKTHSNDAACIPTGRVASTGVV
jgi:hypothetical protein